MSKMLKVFKYQLEFFGTQFISIPKDAKMLSVQTQNGIPCLWAMVDEDNEKTNYTVRTLGTGHRVPSELDVGEYVGTYFINNEELVFHVFIKP